ncbi:MAG: mechanosensitive ion channel domain-containing protein [Thermoplasmata archaeon]|jgi:small conductance mechanosensitive channel
MFGLPNWTTPYLLVATILALTWLVAWIASLVIRGLMRQSAPQVAAGARRLGAVVVWLVGLLLAVQEAGVSIDILVLVVGLFAIAAIVALRIPLENFGAKYFSDVYSPFKVGDSIQVGIHSGKVIEINAMTTLLLSEDDRLIALPNSLLLKETLINASPQAWKELTIPISLPGSVDIAPVESAILKSLSKLRLRLDKRFPPILATKARTVQSTDLVLTVMIRRPEERDALLLEVNKRVHAAIDGTRSRASPPVPAAPETSERT